MIDKIKNRHRDNWIIVLFTRPSLYLLNLIKRTFYMGLSLLVIELIMSNMDVKSQTIPSNMHGLVGLVIGLLLVFRTNTAYDRWWEARKVFAEISANFIYLHAKLSGKNLEKDMLLQLRMINNNIFEFVSSNDSYKNSTIKKKIIEEISEFYNLIKKDTSIKDKEFSNLDKRLSDLIISLSSLERINTTPIPSSYALHIKISIFTYLLSLPIGMFFGLGFYSIPLVMILFFIIAGIEIISEEIENPFAGDPNDLPIERFRRENIRILS